MDGAGYTVDAAGKVHGGVRPQGVNNWGRWGDDDQIGTQNLIGPAERVAAARSIRSGKVFSLALPIDASGPRFHTRPAPLHWFLMTGSDQIAGTPYAAVDPNFQWNDDMFQMPLQGSTQWDAFAHVMHHDTMYNGYWAGNVTAFGGAAVLGIEHHRTSFVGRGVLLDVARSRGRRRPRREHRRRRRRCSSAASSTSESSCARATWCSCAPAICRCGIRRGAPPRSPSTSSARPVSARRRSSGATSTTCRRSPPTRSPSRCSSPRTPTTRRYPVHCGALVDLGLPLGEFWVLDELAADCAADGQLRLHARRPAAAHPRTPSARRSTRSPIK